MTLVLARTHSTLVLAALPPSIKVIIYTLDTDHTFLSPNSFRNMRFKFSLLLGCLLLVLCGLFYAEKAQAESNSPPLSQSAYQSDQSFDSPLLATVPFLVGSKQEAVPDRFDVNVGSPPGVTYYALEGTQNLFAAQTLKIAEAKNLPYRPTSFRGKNDRPRPTWRERFRGIDLDYLCTIGPAFETSRSSKQKTRKPQTTRHVIA